MTHKWRKVSPRLDRSQKWHGLPDDSCRLTYDWLLWSRHTSQIGVFPMEEGFVMAGLRCSFDEATRRLDALEAAGMIERDQEGMLRIVGWFAAAGGAESPATFSAQCKRFKDRGELKDGAMRSTALFEMAYQNVLTAEGWKPDTSQFIGAMSDVTRLMTTEFTRVPELSMAAVAVLELDAPDKVNGTNWGVLLNDVLQRSKAAKTPKK